MQTDKKISSIFKIEKGDIIQLAKAKKVDTIVNSANPSLMMGEGLDEKIHSEINSINGGLESFNDKIRHELDGNIMYAEQIIRCEEGCAVLTKGYLLCDKIVHTVGPYYDKTNSSVQQLENCYKSILKIAFENHEIRKIAIPVISACSKDFEYEKAVKIAVVSINNYLIRLKRKNPVALNEIEEITLVIYQHDEKYQEIRAEYKNIIEKEKISHYRTYIEAQKAYFWEIWKNDSTKRECFSIARVFRCILVLARFLYIPSMLLREMARKKDWEFGKIWIDIEVVLQTIIAMLCVVVTNVPVNIGSDIIFYVFVGYILVDIITYLMGLIFLADIQQPSANVTRSILLIGVNYFSCVSCVAALYYKLYPELGEWAAYDFALLGRSSIEAMNGALRFLLYLQGSINFFFMTLIFAFFIGHLKQRNFSDYNKKYKM